MARIIKTLIALGLSILALIMPGAGKAEESGILYPVNASPRQPTAETTAPRPSFRLCFQMPSIAGPEEEAALIDQANVAMAVKGCSGPVDLQLHLVKNSEMGNPIMKTYAISSLPWAGSSALEDGAYTLFLQNGGGTTQYDSFHFEVAALD